MTLRQQVLIVDDETDFANGLSRLVASAFSDLDVMVRFSGHEALEALEAPDSPPVGVMLLDLNMPGMHGLDVLREVLEKDPNISVVVLTAHGTVETAVAALKNGAWDFLTKPVRREDLLRSLAKGCERNRLLSENQRLRSLMAQSALGQSLIGDSAVMRRLKESISAVASSAYTVLIRGESGTGKELVAEAIHKLSGRQNNSFVGVNCPAIPEQLLESELFGHVKGAFTGAASAHKGLFLQAVGGTLVLDEIGDIPPGIQTKLLRVLQDGEVRPVGSNQSTRMDTRIIAMTNQDLEAKIKAGIFRDDLFYRLNVLTLRTPALRERKEDIPLLATHFLTATCCELQIEQKHLSPSAMTYLCQRDWPGNVRELQNFIRRVTVFCAGAVVDASHLSLGEAGQQPAPLPDFTSMSAYKDAKSIVLESFTRKYMDDILHRTAGNISEAARVSGIERVSLQKILRRLGIDAGEFRK